MLGTYARNELDELENKSELEIDPRSGKRQENTDPIGENIRLSLNANMSVNSEITTETSRAISSEISTQMSRKFEEIKSDLNSHIVEILNAAIEEKVLPTIRGAVGASEGAESTKWDLRSDGRRLNTSGQMPQVIDVESYRRQQDKTYKIEQNKAANLLELITIGSYRETRFRQNSFDSNYSEDEGYDSTVLIG